MKQYKLILLALLCFGCKPEHTTLPPGYKMLCDHKGNYAAMMPGGTVLADYMSWSSCNLPYPNKKTAIERAWEQYNYRPEARSFEELNLTLCED